MPSSASSQFLDAQAGHLAEVAQISREDDGADAQGHAGDPQVWRADSHPLRPQVAKNGVAGVGPREHPASARRLRVEMPCGSLGGMSTLTALPLDPNELRPLLHAEVDKLRPENLLVLHRVALALELEEVTDRLNEGFDADRAAGKLARLPEIIREARAAIHARQPA